MTQQLVWAALFVFGMFQPTKLPADFGFQLLAGVCTFEQVDTTHSRYTRIGPDGRKSAKVKLSASERQHFFELVTATRFFDMPTEIQPPVSADGTITVTAPSPEFRLDIRLGGKTHSVVLRNDSAAKTDDGRRFIQLVDNILSVYRQRREVQRLPKPPFEIYCL